MGRTLAYNRTMPSSSRRVVRGSPLVVVLIAALVGCGIGTPRTIEVAPNPVTLSTVDTTRWVSVGYAGPRGTTLTITATTTNPRIAITPPQVTLAASEQALVAITGDLTGLAAPETGTVRFSAPGVDAVTLSVTLAPNCFIDPDAPLPSALATPQAHPLTGYDAVPGELLVTYRDDPPVADRAALDPHAVARRAAVARAVAAHVGAAVRRSGAPGSHDLLAVPGDVHAAAARLRADPRVEHVTPNYLAHRLAPPDQHYSAQWYLWGFGVDAAWNVEDGSGSGSPVVVAIVDDGVNVRHVNLQPKALPGRDIYCADDDVRALSEHGTHVAGIATAASAPTGVTVGVAIGERVRLLPVKVFDDNPQGIGTLDSVVRGLRWAAGLDTGDGTPPTSTPADVINLSLGFGTTLASGAVALLQQTVDAITARGILLVAAAGNTGAGSGVTYPARLDPVIAVGSVDFEHTRSSFSTYGTGLILMAPGGTAPALVTANTVCFSGGPTTGRHGIVSTGTTQPRSIACLAGTSMASPFVAGAAALLIAHDASYRGNPAATTARLVSTAYLPPGATSHEYGAGVACIDAALGLETHCGSPR
jgi:hypothetical protein